MTHAMSLYLDAMRFLAASAVFLCHVSFKRLTGGFLWQAYPYGIEAVTAFFVLSGFVIAYSSDTRETTASKYIISRAARIYSVALPAIICTFVLDAIGRSLRPEIYPYSFSYGSEIIRFFADVTFSNELWRLHVDQGSNTSYWSLGYEVWYYIIFGLMLYSPSRWRLLTPIVGIIVAGPAIVAMFPIWLLGMGTYHACKRWTLSQRAGLLIFTVSFLGWIAYEAMAWRSGRWLLPNDAWVRRPELPQDFVIGSLLALNIFGFHTLTKALGVLRLRIEKPIRWLAGATFTIYLFHMPVALLLAALVPWPPSSSATRAVVILGTFVLMFPIARLTERRKDEARRVAIFVADWLGQTRPRDQISIREEYSRHLLARPFRKVSSDSLDSVDDVDRAVDKGRISGSL